MARKAATLKRRMAHLLDEHTGAIDKAAVASAREVKDRVVLRTVTTAIEAGNAATAMEGLGLERAAFAELEAAIGNAFNAGGVAMAEGMPIGAQVVVRFDVRNPTAEAWLRDHSSDLVTRILDDQRAGIRPVLAEGLAQGRNPKSVALDIVGRINRVTGQREGGLIGLTQEQMGYVARAQTELSTGDFASYLNRARRDARYDRAVVKAMNSGTSLDTATISKIVARYSDRLLLLRGEMIGRTEALTALNAGKHQAFMQGLGKTNYPPDVVTKVWRSAGDGKVRDTHAALDGQSVHGLTAAFVSPSGAQMLHPGDTSLGAGPAEIINCRCTTDYRIDFSYGVR